MSLTIPVTIAINNQSVTVPYGNILLVALKASSTYIPQLCNGPYMNLNPVSNNKFEHLE